jgi:hypothetical protein
MKKIFVAVAVVALFASCKKDYSCACTTSGNGSNITVTADLGKQKKSDAEDACNAGNATVGGFTTTCVLSEN